VVGRFRLPLFSSWSTAVQILSSLNCFFASTINLLQDLEKYEKLAALPSVQEALSEKYSIFDSSTGDPTHDAAGVLLEGKAVDKAKKETEKQRKVRAPLEKKLAEHPGFLMVLREEVDRLAKELEGVSIA
jgi:hypothetical protein